MPKAKPAAKDTRDKLKEIREAIVEKIGDLFEHHAEEILKVLEESEDKVVGVNYGVKIDASESKVILKVRQSFSQVNTDERVEEFESEDPARPFLPGIHPPELKKKAKEEEKKKKKAGDSPAPEAAPEA